MDRTPTRRRQVLAAAGLGAASLLAGCGSVLGGGGPGGSSDDGQSYSVPDGVTIDWTHTREEIYDPEFRERTIDDMLDGGPFSWGDRPYAVDVVETAEEAADDLRDDGPAGEFVAETDFDDAYVLTLARALNLEEELELADVFYYVSGITVIAWVTGPTKVHNTPRINHLLLRVTGEDELPGSYPPPVDAQFLWPPGVDDEESSESRPRRPHAYPAGR